MAKKSYRRVPRNRRGGAPPQKGVTVRIVHAAKNSHRIKKVTRGRHMKTIRARHGSQLLAVREPRTPMPHVYI